MSGKAKMSSDTGTLDEIIPDAPTAKDIAEKAIAVAEAKTEGDGLTVDEDQMPTGVKNQDLDEFGKDDIQIPWLRLMQGLSEAVTSGEAQSGQWVMDGFEPTNEVLLVVGAAGKYRNMREGESREIVCSASDAKTGVGEPGGECSICPHSKWTDNPKEGGRMLPPACSEGYSFMVYSLTDSMFGRLNLERTGMNAAKSIIRDTKTAGEFGTRVFKLTSRHVQRASRSYYQAQVRVVKDVAVPEDVVEAFEALSV